MLKLLTIYKHPIKESPYEVLDKPSLYETINHMIVSLNYCSCALPQNPTSVQKWNNQSNDQSYSFVE